MAGLLKHRGWAVSLVLALVGTLVVPAGGQAGVFGPWTGYADAHLTGAANTQIYPGKAAMHYQYDYCDPAGSWPFFTTLVPNWPYSNITIHYDGSGSQYAYTAFSVEDIGDRHCALNGNYWVDIYFGRYQNYPTWYAAPTGQNSCFCNNGGPGPSYDTCWQGGWWFDDCQDAVNFGNVFETYDYYWP